MGKLAGCTKLKVKLLIMVYVYDMCVIERLCVEIKLTYVGSQLTVILLTLTLTLISSIVH